MKKPLYVFAYFVNIEPECHFDRIQDSNAREDGAVKNNSSQPLQP